MDTLIEQIRHLATDPQNATDFANIAEPKLAPPATEEQIIMAETALGVQLPIFLSRLYREVGNGGFGPDYGLLGLMIGPATKKDGDESDGSERYAVALYESFHQPDPDDPEWNWPDALLPICNCGCGMYLCVDCATPTGEIVLFEPNAVNEETGWADSFIPIPCDVVQLFAAWAEGKYWLEEFPPPERVSSKEE